MAAVRDRPLPGLPELGEAIEAVFSAGSPLPLQLVQRRLMVGEDLGGVPADTPVVPLQADLEREQRRLRLKPEALEREIDLDLRKETDLQRSHLLHRLGLLDVPWGRSGGSRRQSGTFHEIWKLRWDPLFAVSLIEAAIWGSTLPGAATARVADRAAAAGTLPELTELLERALLADLPDAVAGLMQRVQQMSAVSSDVGLLMESLPPLAGVLRYGSVRRTETGMVAGVVDGIVARICVGLPAACVALNDEAAQAMLGRLMGVHSALATLNVEEHTAAWRETLTKLLELNSGHGLLVGRACRLLLDARVVDEAGAGQRLSLALSRAADPAAAAAWVEGFLGESGLVILHDEGLWEILDAWVCELGAGAFDHVLPLLRRTFSRFPAGERRRMGERARGGDTGPRQVAVAGHDPARGEAALAVAAQLLGIPWPPAEASER
jgi:hypothetical protein